MAATARKAATEAVRDGRSRGAGLILALLGKRPEVDDYQSGPRGLPSSGWTASCQVFWLTPGDTKRTLPSPSPTRMPAENGLSRRLALHRAGPGANCGGRSVKKVGA